ncbi:MAG: hypothetical protein Q8P41_29450 [Pseudomonadota bacterium]|nr:hypothetical protein [Pseudomonadota bacterium]
MFLLLGCSNVHFEGVDGFWSVGSAVALDLHITEGIRPGMGLVGDSVRTSLILTNEVGWCETERARYEALAAVSEAALTMMESDPELCDSGAELLSDRLSLDDHDPDARILTFQLCAGHCTWDGLPVGEPLALPSSEAPSASGVFQRTRDGLDPDGDYWDAETCSIKEEFLDAVSEAWELWELRDGALTFDALREDGGTRGSFEADLFSLEDGSTGTAEGRVDGVFDAQPCVIDVERTIWP